MINKRLGVEHLGYRVIALLITMILWVTVVSQKEIIMVQPLKIQVVVPEVFQINGSSEIEVTVKLEGPRPILKKYIEKSWPTSMMIPLRDPSVGSNTIIFPLNELRVPAEIKIRSINPSEMILQVKKR